VADPDHSLHNPRGLLIVVEGIDGTGKSTLAKGLAQALQAMGWDVVLTFEPTFGPYGKRLRESFKGERRLSPEEELRLFTQDRMEHVKKLIVPSLAQGKIVISDRYYISTMAYQGARGLDPEKIREENESFAPPPDLAILLCLEPEEALQRITQKRGDVPNSFESLEYLERVKGVFDSLDLPFLKRLDASSPKDVLLSQALDLVTPLLERVGT